jgi:signal transduction histidine kinase
MENWFWQTLSDIFNQNEPLNQSVNSQNALKLAEIKAQGEWYSAIASLEQILLTQINLTTRTETEYQGLLLSGPAPVFCETKLISQFQVGIFTPEAFNNLARMAFQLPASQDFIPQTLTSSLVELPLFPNDPITEEQFCLIFTPTFALALVFGTDPQGKKAFHFSFEPEIITKIWTLLRTRLVITNHHQLQRFDTFFRQFYPPTPDYKIVTEFTRQLIKNLPQLSLTEEVVTTTINEQQPPEESNFKSPEIELLQALTHEIRTPLTTIRTLTRLLLKKHRNLAEDVIKRLEVIDQECSEQINRMELIFRATEIEATPLKKSQIQLTSISLEQVFQQSIPRWKKQAQRRNVVLDIILPKKLPTIVGDPAMLDQVLTGLMEKFTRSLPNGGDIKVQVTTAGNQLKLQLLSQRSYGDNPFKSLGQLLMFQPETGSLSLSLAVTKNLFHAMGGKLIVRQHPKQGEVLTIFLPLESFDY